MFHERNRIKQEIFTVSINVKSVDMFLVTVF